MSGPDGHLGAVEHTPVADATGYEYDSLVPVIVDHIAASQWKITALVGGNAVPFEVRAWCQREFGTAHPILAVISQDEDAK